MTQRLTDEQLDALEELEQFATAGEWGTRLNQSVSPPERVVYAQQAEALRRDVLRLECQFLGNQRRDFEFIVAARNALPALIAEVREARRQADEREKRFLEWQRALCAS